MMGSSSRIRRTVFLAVCLNLCLTLGANATTLTSLTGRDWQEMSWSDKIILVSGYAMALKAMEDQGGFEGVLDLPMWQDLLGLSMRQIVLEVDTFYSSPERLSWPLYAALIVRKEALNGSGR